MEIFDARGKSSAILRGIQQARDFRLRSEKDDVNVSSQTSVISEIVAGVIGILVNGDGITTPVPIHDVWPIFGCNLKVIAVEPEPLTVAALNIEDMTWSEPEPELTMREWVVHAGNVLVLDPLFPLYVRPGGRDSAVLLWPAALRLDPASLRSSGFGRCASGLRRCRSWRRAASGLRLCRLWRRATGLGPRLRRATPRTTLRKVLLAGLPAALLSRLRLSTSLLGR